MTCDNHPSNHPHRTPTKHIQGRIEDPIKRLWLNNFEKTVKGF